VTSFFFDCLIFIDKWPGIIFFAWPKFSRSSNTNMCVCVCVCACVRACVFVFWTKIGIFGHERKNLGHLLINFRPTQNKYATYCRIWHICIYRSLLNIYRSLLHICRSLFHMCNVWQVYYLLSDFGAIPSKVHNILVLGWPKYANFAVKPSITHRKKRPTYM